MPANLHGILHSMLWLFLLLGSEVHSQSRTIENAHISFEFPARNVTGTIAGFGSSTSIDLQNLEKSSFEGFLEVETLDTDNYFRDLYLQNARFFDAQNHPRILFKSNSVKVENNKIMVRGTLTIKGISKPLIINFSKRDRQLVGQTELYSSDFGIEIRKERKDNLVKVNLVFDLE